MQIDIICNKKDLVIVKFNTTGLMKLDIPWVMTIQMIKLLVL